ncbi:hypothetical protein EHEL_071220 [Encephalitozoon hellem ATCC 50504]|uniref:Uncharacterized protein n=1 Tax=Encephalitozoon hellem TaxID=27973 RepID=A0A9Q9F9X1_ENCHE|nr:uncharacterized protein EHEL_071220 [Encephalitozoon hellem ATCC 50504]AFM98648.1 hypothetical protein EHEL_071220 [Encephalitozoon hellem ATCC 50504]UTX43597.1 hypothetical protein GPU96_07g13580 [Encephalitozoon hellem]WEL39072.1 hypothetical protein PFJ87_07g01500 [Encephalitozoon hellem]|eukprot:XP_003887629.1 hypothetical protein EHEL_071220 [Encephalitozoon hellem ATCC 50504]
MLSIDDIIGEKDLVQLFRTIVRNREALVPSKQRIIKRIREFGPLSVEDLEGLCDEDILAELEGSRRWSILRRVRKDRH